MMKFANNTSIRCNFGIASILIINILFLGSCGESNKSLSPDKNNSSNYTSDADANHVLKKSPENIAVGAALNNSSAEGETIRVADSILAKDSYIPATIIGSVEWTTTNLNVDHFRNGEIIPEAKTPAEFADASQKKKPVWCYPNFDSTNGKLYGKLYNYWAVSDERGLAPSLWELPTKEVWDELLEYITNRKSKENDAGTKLKSIDVWDDINFSRTRETEIWKRNTKSNPTHDIEWRKGMSLTEFLRKKLYPRDKFYFNALPSGLIQVKDNDGLTSNFVGAEGFGDIASWWTTTEFIIQYTATGLKLAPPLRGFFYISTISKSAPLDFNYTCPENGHAVRCWRPVVETSGPDDH